MKGQPIIQRWGWPEERPHAAGATVSLTVIEALFFKCGLRTDEIAVKFGISEAAVANSLHRLREKRRQEAEA